MLRRTLLRLLPIAFASIALGQAAAAPLKVACVGDSITAGSGVKDKSMPYPKQLAALLGDSYTVQNSGVSGATMLNAGDKPYQKEKRFADALAFVPDIVVIKLGPTTEVVLNEIISLDKQIAAELKIPLIDLHTLSRAKTPSSLTGFTPMTPGPPSLPRPSSRPSCTARRHLEPS